MIETITATYGKLMAVLASNQMMAAAVSLWGLSVVTFLLRDVPRRFARFVAEQTTTSFTLMNSGSYSNQVRYNAVMEYIARQKGFGWSRSLALRTSISWGSTDKTKAEKEIQPGFGFHFFVSDGRLFWYIRSKVDSSATDIQKEVVTIRTYGRSHKPFYKFYNDVFPEDPDKKTSVYRWTGDNWENLFELQKRPFNTVITRDGIKDTILANMEKFLASEAWYVEKGINWKEVYVLHGPPGTGKTGLIRALASKLNKDIYLLDLSILSNQSFQTALSSVPPGSICAIEDFDDSISTHKRSKIEKNKPKPKLEKEKDVVSTVTANTTPVEDDKRDTMLDLLIDRFTLSGMLNTLDGISSLHGVIIIMTTNCIDKIDPALLRSGRCDYSYYIGWLGDKEIREYADVMFPGIYIPENIVFNDIAGCDLYNCFKENRTDPDKFVEAIYKITNPGDIIIDSVLKFISKFDMGKHVNAVIAREKEETTLN